MGEKYPRVIYVYFLKTQFNDMLLISNRHYSNFLVHKKNILLKKKYWKANFL